MNNTLQPPRVRMLARRDGPWLGLAWLLVVMAMIGLWQTPQAINHDCAMYLQEADLLLGGAVPYCDFVETNPPLIVYLNVLPAWLARELAVSPIVVFQSLVIALVALSALEIYLLMRKPRFGFRSLERGLVLLAWIALYFVVDGQGNLGQREHLFVLLYIPYLFLRILRRRGGSIAGWFAVLLGLQAGIGVSLKPYFLLAAVGVEIALLLARRRRGVLLQPENFALAAIVVTYLAHWLIVPPAMREAFFFRWLPLVGRGYDAYNVSYGELIRTILGSPISVVALTASLIAALYCSRQGTRGTHRFGSRPDAALAFVALAGMGLGLIFLQQKGWSYHRIPLDAGGLLCLALLAASYKGGRRKADGGGKNLQPPVFNPPSPFPPPPSIHYPLSTFHFPIGCALVIGVAVWLGVRRQQVESEPPEYAALRQIIQQRTQPGDRVLVVATSVRPAYPMLLQTGRKPGSRYLCCFPIALCYAGTKPTADRPIYHRRQDAPPEERRFLDELGDDVGRLRPRLIIIQDGAGWLGLPTGFNTFEYLVYSGWAGETLTPYGELPSPAGWKVLERQ